MNILITTIALATLFTIQPAWSNSITAQDISEAEICYSYASAVNEVKKLREQGYSKGRVEEEMRKMLKAAGFDLPSNSVESHNMFDSMMTIVDVGELSYKRQLRRPIQDKKARHACGLYLKAANFVPHDINK